MMQLASFLFPSTPRCNPSRKSSSRISHTFPSLSSGQCTGSADIPPHVSIRWVPKSMDNNRIASAYNDTTDSALVGHWFESTLGGVIKMILTLLFILLMWLIICVILSVYSLRGTCWLDVGSTESFAPSNIVTTARSLHLLSIWSSEKGRMHSSCRKIHLEL